MTPERWKCTLYATFASASPTAVIYRRGPTKHTCLIAWDRSDDSFQVGQWFEGMVKPSWGGLSPDGRWLITFMGKYRGPYGTWTVLSKPPYFTAISLWPMGDTWYGGGWFLTDRELVLRHWMGPYDLAPGFEPPPGIEVLPYGPELRDAIDRRGRATPWIVEPQPDRSDRAVWRGSQGHRLVRTCEPRGTPLSREPDRPLVEVMRHHLVVSGGQPVELPRADWAAFDGNGDLLFSEGGRLYRLAAEAFGSVTCTAGLLDAARCLADFSDLRFTAVRAPYAQEVRPGDDGGLAPSGFAPRLDRTSRETRRRAKRLRKLADRTKPSQSP